MFVGVDSRAGHASSATQRRNRRLSHSATRFHHSEIYTDVHIPFLAGRDVFDGSAAIKFALTSSAGHKSSYAIQDERRFSEYRFDSTLLSSLLKKMPPNRSARETLYFDSIKEDRGSYFVEYQPPVSTNPFATLTLVYPETYEVGAVAEAMKSEVTRWLNRYPVPIMAGACDSGENTICPFADTGEASLFGWYSSGTSTASFSWKAEGLPSFFNDTTNLPDWRAVYKDVPFRTDTEVKANAYREAVKIRRQNLTLKVILAMWLAVIPATWAVVEFLGPTWLAVAVLLYSLLEAYGTAHKLFWPVVPSQAEKYKAEKELKMRHYYWHCEQNPNGFARLRAENFEREAKEQTRMEVESLRNSK